ncbi:MAG TPA: hypothetical protein VF937_16240, partial [Chloroflexota bacterium]
LSSAVLTARDGTRYRPLRSTTSFGQRTATSHALTTYPVLLRLPSGFRVAAESAGTLSVVAPDRGSLTFKIPSGLTDYGTLTIPPLTNLGPKTGDDDVTRQMRPLIAGFHSLDLAGMSAGRQSVSFPTATSPTGLLSVGMPASGPGKVTVTLTAVEASDPDDFEIRNRGWKQVTVSLRYRNDDASQTNGFSVAAWLFGTDGVVYTGDAPTIGDFGRALTPPKAASILLWDGRSAGADQVAPGLAPEPRRAAFLVPRELTGGVLVLSGDVEAMYDLSSIPTPPKP